MSAGSRSADCAVARSELDRREIAVFQREASSSSESEGILDRAGVPPAETIANARRILDSLEKLSPNLVELAPPSLAPRDLQRVHDPIVGRFRVGGDGPVGFGVPVLDEHGERLVTHWVDGAAADEIRPRLEAAFAEFHTDTAARGRLSTASAARAVARLQTDVITIHPFVDGNGRATNVLMEAALQQLGRPELTTIPRDWELVVARSYAVRPDDKRSIEPLADLIARRPIAARRN